MQNNKFDEDYFMRGKESGKSLYENYRWLPELTIPMCETIVKHCGIQRNDLVLDYGCARGYIVKALTKLGYHARGVDISQWAIENSDSEVRDKVRLIDPDPTKWVQSPVDWVIAKDVLEHIPFVYLVIDQLMNIAMKGIFVVVPLSEFNASKYIIDEYEKDITHCQRYPISHWINMFLKPGWSVESSYRIPGIKDNYWKQGWERGNGFLTVKRIGE